MTEKRITYQADEALADSVGIARGKGEYVSAGVMPRFCEARVAGRQMQTSEVDPFTRSSSGAKRVRIREKSLSEWVLVAIGGAAGTPARVDLDALTELFPYSGVLASFTLLPWSTLLANLGGAFFLGALSAFLTRRMELTPQFLRLRPFAATGPARVFTTYGSLITAGGMAMIQTPNVIMILSAIAASLLLPLLGIISAAGGWGFVKKLARVAEMQRISTMKRKTPSKDAEVCETGGSE